MKLSRFAIETPLARVTRIGAVSDGFTVDLNLAYQGYLQSEGVGRFEEIADALIPSDMLDFIMGGEATKNAAKQALGFALQQGETHPDGRRVVYHTDRVRMLTPLRPGKMLCLSHNFSEDSGQPTESPLAFLKMPSVVIGPDENIVHPKITKKLDYEIEIALIIGKEGKNISKENWREYVFGYTIFNDISARDIQSEEMKRGVLNIGKNLDGFAPLGPHIVTADEIDDPHNLDLELRVNDSIRQKSNTRYMINKFDEALSYFSTDLTLYPGDVICSGSPKGFAKDNPNKTVSFLKPSDKIEAEVDRIGILRNFVV